MRTLYTAECEGRFPNSPVVDKVSFLLEAKTSELGQRGTGLFSGS